MLYYAYLNIGVGYAVQQRIQQLKCEKETDLIVSKMLDAVGIKHNANGSKILSVANALKTASKKGNGKQGFPEYTAKVKDFILVIEDKADTAHQAKYIKGGQTDNNVLLMDISLMPQGWHDRRLCFPCDVMVSQIMNSCVIT